MKATRSKGMSLVAVSIVLAVYNVIVFVLPFHRGNGFWVGYAFSMLAFVLMAGVSLHGLGREGMISKFYGVPLVMVAWAYLIVQLIVGLVEIIVPVIPYQAGVVVNVVLLGICLVGLIAVNMGKEEIERVDERVRGKVFYIRSLQADVEGLVTRTADDSLRQALCGLSEAIMYSDPMSSPQLASLENMIEAKTATLANCMYDTDAALGLCAELQQLLAERNRRCMMSK